MRAVAHKEEDRTKAAVISVILHAILLALLFFLQIAVKQPVLEAPPIVIDWGGGGSNAAAGTPDRGQGKSPAPEGQQLDDPRSNTPAEKPAPVTPPTPSTPPPKATTPASSTTPTSADPDVAALRRAQDDARRKQQQEDDRRKQEEAAQRAAEQQRIAAEQERLRKEKEELEKKKGTFGGAFGKPGATGTGQGNTGQPGNQGQPGGTGTNPTGTAGTGTGTGGGDGSGVGESIGGGLSGRRVVGRPKMVDDTQNTGRVAVRVCVRGDGSVSSATYTQLGSTTTDAVLRNKAEGWARQYRFAASDASEQCGTITFDFRVK